MNVGNTHIDGRIVRVGLDFVRLSRQEHVLLTTMIAARGAIVSADTLQFLLGGSASNMRQVLSRLRDKMDRLGCNLFINTIHGAGYTLVLNLFSQDIRVTPSQLAALKTAVEAFEAANPRIAAIARSAL